MNESFLTTEGDFVMLTDATFKVPLTRLPPAAKGRQRGDLVFTLVPSTSAPSPAATPHAPPPLKGVSVSLQP